MLVNSVKIENFIFRLSSYISLDTSRYFYISLIIYVVYIAMNGVSHVFCSIVRIL